MLMGGSEGVAHLPSDRMQPYSGGLCKLDMTVQYCWLLPGGLSLESIGVLVKVPDQDISV